MYVILSSVKLFVFLGLWDFKMIFLLSPWASSNLLRAYTNVFHQMAFLDNELNLSLKIVVIISVMILHLVVISSPESDPHNI